MSLSEIFGQVINIVGLLIGVVGLVYGWRQGVRLAQLRRRTNADVWLSIRTAGSMLEKLEQSAAFKENGDKKLPEVYGKLTEHFRQLVKQAVLDENKFTEATIQSWRSSGRLANTWQAEQARVFLETGSILTTGPPDAKS